jgi:hypothetical protein
MNEPDPSPTSSAEAGNEPIVVSGSGLVIGAFLAATHRPASRNLEWSMRLIAVLLLLLTIHGHCLAAEAPKLTDAERAWLADHKDSLVLSYDRVWPWRPGTSSRRGCRTSGSQATGGVTENLSIGVGKHYPLLASAVAKALAALPASGKTGSAARWMEGLPPNTLFDAQTRKALQLAAVLTLAILAVLAVLAWILACTSPSLTTGRASRRNTSSASSSPSSRRSLPAPEPAWGCRCRTSSSPRATAGGCT